MSPTVSMTHPMNQSQRNFKSHVINVASRCCAQEGRTVLSRRVQWRASDALAVLGALDPHRVSFPERSIESLEQSDHSFGQSLLANHIMRIIRGATDFMALQNAYYAAQEILRFYRCRPAEDNDLDTYSAPHTS